MIILVGASASGKTAIARYLIDTFHFKKFVTTTTRKMRIGEKQNIDYHFLTNEEFENKIKNNSFIEYTTYNGFNYGSEQNEIGANKILIVEPNGLNSYLALNDKSIVTFYIECDKKIREKRMIERKDDSREIKERILGDEKIFTNLLKTKVNFTLDSSTDDIKTIGDKIYNLYLNVLTSSK
jgi:Guanylate kinase